VSEPTSKELIAQAIIILIAEIRQSVLTEFSEAVYLRWEYEEAVGGDIIGDLFHWPRRPSIITDDNTCITPDEDSTLAQGLIDQLGWLTHLDNSGMYKYSTGTTDEYQLDMH